MEVFDDKLAASGLAGDLHSIRFVDQQCGEDAALRAAVRALLQHETAASDAFLAGRPANPNGSTVIDAITLLTSDPQAPRRIGRFTIVRKIGEGGMGIVFEARQDQPRRTVAMVHRYRAGVVPAGDGPPRDPAARLLADACERAPGLVDTATGQSVVLSLVSGVVQGRTATSNDLVFTVSVDSAAALW